MTLKVQGNTVVDTNLTYTVNGANVSASGNVNWSPTLVGDSVFQGSASGYVSGGILGPAPPTGTNVIEKFPFAAATTNTTDVGDLTHIRWLSSGYSSLDNGYTVGGLYSISRVIDKFPFASDTNASAAGTIYYKRYGTSGSASQTHGYTAGGYSSTYSRLIEKFSFAYEGEAVSSGGLTYTRYVVGGASSTTHGYSGGGSSPAPQAATSVEKFQFASDTNAAVMGTITDGSNTGGNSSDSNGYLIDAAGGVSKVSKFPFASDTNATDVLDLSVVRANVGSQSSTDYGYNVGGSPTAATKNEIDRFPFASDINATDVGDLVAGKAYPVGNQARTLS